MAPSQIPGVFCVEGAWKTDMRVQSTIRPVFDVLEGQRIVDSIHRTAATREELAHYLRACTQKRYDKFRLIYLAFHGEPGLIRIGRQSVELEEVAEMLGGRASRSVVYFDSCSTVDVPKRRLDDFLKVSGAKAVGGYSTDVDWLESVAFDLLIIEALTRYQRVDAADRWLQKEYGSTVRKLKFKLHW